MQQSQQVGGGLEEGVQTSVKAGIDPHGVPKMFRILLNERQSNPGAVDAFFATHPLEESRIAATPNRSRRIRRRSCGI